MSILRSILKRVAAVFPLSRVRTVTGLEGDYLTRYILWDGGRNRGRVAIHRFHRNDEDEELHNHPWRGTSLILVGGYYEERMELHLEKSGPYKILLPKVISKVFPPFSVVTLEPNTFHRVDLLEEDCWTIFFSGPVVQSWGFLDRDSLAFFPWREFIKMKTSQQEAHPS